MNIYMESLDETMKLFKQFYEIVKDTYDDAKKIEKQVKKNVKHV